MSSNAITAILRRVRNESVDPAPPLVSKPTGSGLTDNDADSSCARGRAREDEQEAGLNVRKRTEGRMKRDGVSGVSARDVRSIGTLGLLAVRSVQGRSRVWASERSSPARDLSSIMAWT